MDSLRQMREHMADRINALQRRSLSPAVARSDLEILAKQQLMRASGQKADQAMLQQLSFKPGQIPTGLGFKLYADVKKTPRPLNANVSEDESSGMRSHTVSHSSIPTAKDKANHSSLS